MGLRAKNCKLLLGSITTTVYFIVCVFAVPVYSGDDRREYMEPRLVWDPILKLNRIYRSATSEDANNATYPTHFTYLRKNVECKASFAVQPTNLQQLQQIVRYALDNNYKVKAVGKLITKTDAICTDGILVDMKEIKHYSFSPEKNQATVGAGMELTDFLEQLHENGRGLTGLPTYGWVTIGGAVGVGSHGTNLKHFATLSDQITSLKFVDGEGNVRQISEGDEDFKAFRVNLGLLGIVYEFVFKTVGQYKLEMKNLPMSDEILWNGQEILRMAESHDSFQFFWFPTNKQIVILAGKEVAANVTGNCRANMVPLARNELRDPLHNSLEQMQNTENELGYFYAQSLTKLSLYEDVPGRLPFYMKDEEDGHPSSCLPVAVGYSHRMMTSSMPEGYAQLRHSFGSYIVDLSEMEGAIQTLKEITDMQLVGFPISGVHFRFLKESDGYLGLSRNKPSLQIELTTPPREDGTLPKMGITAFQAIGQALVERHGARPHWSKNDLYYMTRPVIQPAYPDLSKFVDVMKRMDPHDVFMNEFGRRLKYGSSEMTALSPAAKLRCALNEACLCKTDLDCGDGSPAAYVCGRLKEFKVCQRKPTPWNMLKDATNREIINSAAKLADNVEYLMEALALYKGFGDLKP